MSAASARSGGATRSRGFPGGAGAVAACTGAAILWFVWEARHVYPQLDDAYISYRYARNLVEGHGLVYNLGEYVEGFTNLSWTLLVAAGLALGFEAPVVGHLLGAISGVALLLVSAAYARMLLGGSAVWLAGLAPWIVLASRPFATWTLSGMETPLFAALATAALAAQGRGRLGWAATAATLATLTRPDGVLVAVVALGGHTLSPRDRGRRAAIPIAAYLAVMGLVTVFRVAYYGSPVPNTFYAKVGDVPPVAGFGYLAEFLSRGPAFLLWPAAISVLWTQRATAGGVFVAVWVAYVVAIGGDAFVESRFLLPVVPVLAGLCIRGVASAYESDARLGVLAFSCIPAAVCWSLFDFWTGTAVAVVGLAAWWASDRSLRYRREVSIVVVCVALPVLVHFATHRPDPGARGSDPAFPISVERVAGIERQNHLPDAWVRRQAEILLKRRLEVRLVAHGGIGRFGYYSGLPILDIFGLVDPEVARRESRPGIGSRFPGHQRSNPGYVLGRRPDYILIPKRLDAHAARFPRAVVALWNHPHFQAEYEWDREVGGYRRRDRAPGDASR